MQLCKFFPENNAFPCKNLHMNMNFTHLYGDFTQPFPQSYWNFTFSFQSIIHSQIYAVLLLAKLVPIYAILCVGFLAQKSGRVKFWTNFKSRFNWAKSKAIWNQCLHSQQQLQRIFFWKYCKLNKIALTFTKVLGQERCKFNCSNK